MTDHLSVVIYDSSVLIGLAREQLRFTSVSPNWQPGLDGFPPATPREPNHDAIAAARLSTPDAAGVRGLQAEVIIAKRSLSAAVRTVTEIVSRSPQSARAQEVANGLAMTIVTALGPCIVNDLTDATRCSERDEIEAQVKVRPALVVASRVWCNGDTGRGSCC